MMKCTLCKDARPALWLVSSSSSCRRAKEPPPATPEQDNEQHRREARGWTASAHAVSGDDEQFARLQQLARENQRLRHVAAGTTSGYTASAAAREDERLRQEVRVVAEIWCTRWPGTTSSFGARTAGCSVVASRMAANR
uniref:Uncharacterized protein n=1 Tax=Oryza nivara TaxID=4536 RepID=A0A0E0IV02_ORYNI